MLYWPKLGKRRRPLTMLTGDQCAGVSEPARGGGIAGPIDGGGVNLHANETDTITQLSLRENCSFSSLMLISCCLPFLVDL